MNELFDAVLEYVTGMDPVVSSEGREGDYIGSGTGRLSGRRVSGPFGSAMGLQRTRTSA